MRRDGRTRAIEYYEKKVKEHLTALEIIKSIPMNKVLHITTRQCLLQDLTSYKKVGKVAGGKVVIPLTWNGDSIRCQVLAVEHLCYDSRAILEKVKRGDDCKDPIRFLEFLNWKEFNKNDAGLYVNWVAITPEFKRIAFDA